MMSEAQRMHNFQSNKVSYRETSIVKEGVECEVYKFDDDETKDLGIIKVDRGCSTPLQRVLQGSSTIEGYLDGKGTLTVTDGDGTENIFEFAGGESGREIEVIIGQTMQWTADPDSDLIFYEICTPPYQDGRYENL